MAKNFHKVSSYVIKLCHAASNHNLSFASSKIDLTCSFAYEGYFDASGRLLMGSMSL